jgi:hypothetical protein
MQGAFSNLGDKVDDGIRANRNNRWNPPWITSGPSAFSPRRSVASDRRFPTHSKRRHDASIW